MSTLETAAAQHSQSNAVDPAQLAAHVGRVLLRVLAMLPEAAAINKMSIRPLARMAALNELRSDRAGASLTRIMANLTQMGVDDAPRLRCAEVSRHPKVNI